MKQVININFQGRVVPIEVTAFDMLKSYTESLSRHFANEEGKEEIINDIESRIGELFQERIKSGATCITDDDVHAIIKSMGRPEDFETEEGATSTASAPSSDADQQTNYGQQTPGATGSRKRLYRDENNKILGGVCAGIANYFGMDAILVRILFVLSGIGFLAYILLWAFVPNNADGVIGVTRKKLYRDSDDKIIAGVCSGIGHYFGINQWIPRVLFALPFLSFVFRRWDWGFFDFSHFLSISFSPGALILYIILWAVLPEAFTTAEKLEMKGEKVDLNSIKESVKEEMKGFQQKAEKFGKEASGFVNEKAKIISTEAQNFTRQHRTGFGDVIATIAKIFAYFVIGCIGFALVVALFALAVAAIGVFPLKDFLVRDGWQNANAWGTLLFFIALPVIGVITWIVRRLAKARANSRMLRLTFISLWVVGWINVTMLVASLSKDFRYTNINSNSKILPEEDLILSNPLVNKLEITSISPIEKYTRRNWLRFAPFAGVNEDTAYVKNFEIRIVKSATDSFRVTVIKLANGRTRPEAEIQAGKIDFTGLQSDSILRLDRGLAINKTDKFRNQRIIISVYVPVGKKIMIDKSVGWYNNVDFDFNFNDNNDWESINWDDDAHDWSSNVTYIMKADGQLYSAKDGKPASHRQRSFSKVVVDGKVIRDGENPNPDEDAYRYNQNAGKRSDSISRRTDSLQRVKEQRIQRQKDSLDREAEKIERLKEKLDNSNEPSAFFIPSGLPGLNTFM
jgi:phage shock protein PspC (stress-responsive transcriptional regulator)